MDWQAGWAPDASPDASADRRQELAGKWLEMVDPASIAPRKQTETFGSARGDPNDAAWRSTVVCARSSQPSLR